MKPKNGIFSFLTLELGDIRGEAAACILLIPILLAAVFWNGFPIIYYDTGAYVFEGLGGHFMVERSPVYSLFLRYGGGETSLWFIAAIQAGATAFAMTQCARAEAPRMRMSTLLLVGAVLALVTGLPWYVGQIEPDCFTALVVLTIYLLAFRARVLGFGRTLILLAIGGFAAATHPSHLLLSAFLLAAIAAARLCLGVKPRLLESACVCVLGMALIFAANFHFTRQVFFSRAGSSFVFARMLQDGIVMRLLDDTCPQSGYRLCAYRDSLPPTADGWLWTSNSPFFKLGHFEGTEADSARIVRDALLRYPLWQVRAGIRDAALQFVSIKTGDQIEPQEWVLAPVLARYLPTQMSAYLAARQQRGEIHFRSIGWLHEIVGYFSLAGLVVLLAMSLQAKRHEQAAFLGMILIALIGNAIICGVLSGPHDRYQSRLVWLAPFALLLSVRSRAR
ncbi:MAG TPA: hypothetical protein VGI20_01970 [Rhizomicrobium sp.]